MVDKVHARDAGLNVGDSVVLVGREKKGEWEVVEFKRLYVILKSKVTGKVNKAKPAALSKVGDVALTPAQTPSEPTPETPTPTVPA